MTAKPAARAGPSLPASKTTTPGKIPGKIIDLGIFWEWEYDRDFVLILDRACQKQGISSYMAHPWNFRETYRRVRDGELRFRHVVDRASDVHDGFSHLAQRLAGEGCRFINPPEKLGHAIDKAAMHVSLQKDGIDVPFTVLLDPYEDDPLAVVHPSDLKNIGSPFIVKPAQGGGGIGVVLGARSHCDIVRARAEYSNDRYLVQEVIEPESYRGKRYWFRVFYACGRVIPCWWDDRTGIYSEMTDAQKTQLGLQPLEDITRRIAALSGLDFFSSEIVKNAQDRFIAIDYVNDMCDMRIASLHRDGVPDRVVKKIADTLAEWAAGN